MATHPIALPEAFTDDSPDGYQSQAAFLLFLGVLDHREKKTGEGFVTKKIPLPWDDLGLDEDYRTLGIPEQILDLQKASARRTGLSGLKIPQMGIASDSAKLDEWLGRPGVIQEGIGELQQQLAITLFEEPNFRNVARLTAVSVHHHSPLVRVAAASTCFDVMKKNDFRKIAGPVLIEGTYSDDDLVRNVAATALARIAPDHPRIIELTAQRTSSDEDQPSNTSLMVHGTWARNNSWWQPSGDFHSYILNSVDNSLYSGADRFEWSGGWSDNARSLGAFDLADWITQKGWHAPDLFTHSHGGSIAMLANRDRAIDIGLLVLLSCPVHKNKYWPDFNRTRKVVSVRVHMDLVILADGGGQNFQDPRIHENVLPLWFDHSTTHDPDTWIQHNIQAML